MRRAVGHLAAVGGVGVTTAILALIDEEHAQIANISMAYLVAVLLTAVAFGRGPAITASAAAFLAFNWVFVEPHRTFAIADPAEYVSLVLFLVTAIVVGTLASSQRSRAEEAVAREREAIVLSDVVQLLARPDLPAALHAVASRLVAELDLDGVAIRIEEGAAPQEVLVGGRGAVAALRGPAGGELFDVRPPTATERGGPARRIRLVPPYAGGGRRDTRVRVVPAHLGERRVATIALLARESSSVSRADERLLAAVAAELAAAVERDGLRRAEVEAEVLRRTDDLRKALLGAVSHELRTPLASIIAASGSLRQRDVSWSDEDREELARAIEDEARRLDRIVGNLLDLSRVEAGAIVPQKGWYDPGALVDEVLGRIRAGMRDHRVNVRVADDLPPVHLDYVEIAQVLMNLIDNATKFSPPGSEIDVSVSRADGTVRFEVADRGSGVPGGDASRVFEPFERLDRDARIRGTGLGLAVARRLVEAHGGRVGVEPRDGGGARFFFTVPA